MAGFAELKHKQRALREGFAPDFGLRVHRALSWLNRAEQAGEDLDARFLFLWIAFNAIYAADLDAEFDRAERDRFRGYFEQILSIDEGQQIYHAIWQEFADSIRVFITNPFVFQPFWKFHNGEAGNEDWQARLGEENDRIVKAFARQDSLKLLEKLFDRLYVLRNQLVHGGASWGSRVNRGQLRDGTRILGFLVPVFIDLMMDNAELDWGRPYYPVIEAAG